MAAKKHRILGIGAHPDDMDFTASGTIAKFVKDGADAYYVLCTDGSRGSEDPKMTHEKLAAMRREEQLAAGKVLGLKDIFFLDHPDTQLQADLLLKEQLVRIIRTVRPTIVITMNPTFYYSTQLSPEGTHFINHTDHRAAALAAMDAVFPMARDRLTFPEHEEEGLKPHKVSELWFTAFDRKEYVVDITETIEQKVNALACHKSQFNDFPGVKTRITRRAIEFAKEEEFQFAENFIRLIMP